MTSTNCYLLLFPFKRLKLRINRQINGLEKHFHLMLSVLCFDETKSVFTNRSAEIIFVMKSVISCLKDDEDGHLVVLTIIEELMSKRQEEFLDHFARLGVFSKVQLLMGTGGEPEIDVIKSQEDASCSRAAKGKD